MSASSRPLRPWMVIGFASLPLIFAVMAWLGFAFVRQGGATPWRVPVESRQLPTANPAVVERGRYLARLGNCAGCHTAPGGEPYAGGRAFATPYGTVFSSNLTPDPETGIGDWSLAEFRHTMRHGVSRNGMQSPVFPYANFALLDEADVDALFVHLAQLRPVARARRENALTFPANLPGAMAVWRLFNHRPQALPPVPAAPEPWLLGRELVLGIGHCSMCHGARGFLGSLDNSAPLSGGSIPGWHAPALDAEALARYSRPALAQYLRHGSSEVAMAYGPMAEVVFGSLQHLDPGDADAIAGYLKSLPAGPTPTRRRIRPAGAHQDNGAELYQQHCAACHGDDGEGEAGRYPPLRGSVAVTAGDPVNAINVIMLGAMAPATAGNPQPWSMPPFAQQLSEAEIVALVNHIRARWGIDAAAVGVDEVRAQGSVYR